MNILGGVLHQSGNYYLLIEPDAGEENEAIVFVGRQIADQIRLSQIGDIQEISDIVALSSEWSSVAEAVAITDSGNIIFYMPGAARSEPVPGAGYESADAKNLGFLVSISEVEERIIVTGYEAQVYALDTSLSWVDVSPHRIAPGAVFSSVVSVNDGSLLFSGRHVTELASSSEIDAANDAGDADLLAELILDATDSDKAIFFTFNTGWQQLDIDLPAETATTVSYDGYTFYIISETGVIWSTQDFMAFEEIWAPSAKTSFDDVKAGWGTIFFLADNNLFHIEAGVLNSFPVPLPETSERCISISPMRSGVIAAIFPTFVLFYENETWRRLEVEIG